MTERRPGDLLDGDGPAAPPRANGELVFAAPWESRLFGLTMTLHERGLFVWDEFRDLLIDEIGSWDRAPRPGEWSYYACWQAALERLLAAKGLLGAPEVDARTNALAARPHGHDH